MSWIKEGKKCSTYSVLGIVIAIGCSLHQSNQSKWTKYKQLKLNFEIHKKSFVFIFD